MNLSTIFGPDDVLIGQNCPTKMKALQLVCERTGRAIGIDPAALVDVIRRREDLGSTGIGRGIAVPHASVPGLAGLRGFIFRLSKPIDFEAIDGAPVDLIFLLVFEEAKRTDYLKVLASIARKAHSDETLQALRNAATAEAVHAIFVAAEDKPVAPPQHRD